MSDDLIKRLRTKNDYPAYLLNPDGPEAADRIYALEAENKRLRNEYIKNGESCVVSNLRSIADEQAARITKLEDLLAAWVQLAREHLDSELAGRTFAALLEGENRD